MVAIADFIDDVLDDVDGCNKYAATKAIRKAAIEFCKESECWQYPHDDIPLIAGRREVELSLPADARLRRIVNMLNATGDSVTEKDDRWLDENIENWRTATEKTADVKYFNQSAQDVVIVGVPLTTVVPALFGVKMVLVPTQDATTLDDVLWDDFKDNIEDGAKYYLMRQKGKVWSDPEMAAAYRISFMKSWRDARYIMNKGFSGGTLNVSGTDYTKESGSSTPWYETED